MEVFRGDPQKPEFQQWLKQAMQNKKSVTAIVGDDISCYEAREIMRKNSLNRNPWQLDLLKRALLHLITCGKNQQCRQLLRGSVFQVS